MSFKIKDDNVLDKYSDKLSIKFHSMSVYDQTYIKAEVKEFDGVIKTNFLGNEIPKENMHYSCIPCLHNY